MKSIQTKIILLILVVIIVSTAVIGGTGIITFGQAIDDTSVKVMNLMCNEKAGELNNILGRIEQSVDILAVYSYDNLDSVNILSENEEYLEHYTEEIAELGMTIANETEGAVAVYVRFAPEVTSSKAGFFKVKNLKTGRFEETELTDISKYSDDDIEHVGWYYIPVKAGKAVWLQPYYNKNIGIYMISYVVPIYKDDRLFGIVGMDIDFGYITDICDSIEIYKSGYAFLTDDRFNIVHSKNREGDAITDELGQNIVAAKKDDMAGDVYEYTIDGVKKKAVFEKMENGMFLAVTAPVAEIDATKNRLVMQILISFIIIAAIFILMANVIAKNIVRPLKELDAAAQQIAGGNLDVSLACNSKDEVGTLSKSLRKMADQLKIHMEYISNLAFSDRLTGVNNNTAYINKIAQFREEIENSDESFAVFVIDVNGLKIINDTYGHDYGNRLIVAVSRVLAEVFGKEYVYRIGGDEFVVLIKNADRIQCSELERKFEDCLKNQNGEIKASAAIGFAIYDKEADSSYERMFRRADDEMYKSKLRMKTNGETSVVEEQNKSQI